MLILSRREGDGLSIGAGIRIVVLGSDHRGVRLGIEAPSDVRILRDELAAAVVAENRRASVSSKVWLDVVPISPTMMTPRVVAAVDAGS